VAFAGVVLEEAGGDLVLALTASVFLAAALVVFVSGLVFSVDSALSSSELSVFDSFDLDFLGEGDSELSSSDFDLFLSFGLTSFGFEFFDFESAGFASFDLLSFVSFDSVTFDSFMSPSSSDELECSLGLDFLDDEVLSSFSVGLVLGLFGGLISVLGISSVSFFFSFVGVVVLEEAGVILSLTSSVFLEASIGFLSSLEFSVDPKLSSSLSVFDLVFRFF